MGIQRWIISYLTFGYCYLFIFPNYGFDHRLLFFYSIHQEVASGPFCLLVNCPWLLVFALCVFFFSLSGFNLYCWKGKSIHFSWSYEFVLFYYFFGLVIGFHFCLRDLLREFYKKYEILLMVLFLVFSFFFFLKLSYLYPFFGHLSIHYLLQVVGFRLEKVSMFQILVNELLLIHFFYLMLLY